MNQVEHTYHSISTSNGEHVSLIREITREDSATKLLDLSHRLEGVNTVENLDLIASRSSGNNVLTGSLHELGAVNLARRGRLEVAVVPGDVIEQFTIVEGEHGELVTSLVRSSEDDTVLNIEGVGSNVGSEDTSDGSRFSHVPHLDGLVPTSSNDEVLVDPLDTVDFHLVTGSTGATTLVQNLELAGLFIIHTDESIGIAGGEVRSVVVVITADGLNGHETLHFLDLVQQTTGSGVPMLNDTIAVGSQNDVLGHSRSSEGSPPFKIKLNVTMLCLKIKTFGANMYLPNHLGGHGILHILVEDVTLLTSEYIKNADGSVTTSSSNVLIVPVKAYAESRDVNIS